MKKKNVFALLGACIVLGSCSTGDTAMSAMRMLGGSSQALLFLGCRAVSEDEVEFKFSQPVKVKYISFDPVFAAVSVENGSTVKVKLGKKPEPGITVTADLLAEDAHKNTINVLVPFRSRNNRMPSLVINELRTENTKPKAEFVELKMKSAGNLGAMRVFIASNNKNPLVYEFLPIEVGENEYITLHLRTTEETCADEYGSSLSESGGTDSSDKGRDFWYKENIELLRKTDAVYVLDQDDNVLDAVMICETPDSIWKKDYFAETAEFLFKQGAWKTADGKICVPADSVISANTTNTRTICRDEKAGDTNTAADWYISATSGATPGKPNSEKRF